MADNPPFDQQNPTHGPPSEDHPVASTTVGSTNNVPEISGSPRPDVKDSPMQADDQPEPAPALTPVSAQPLANDTTDSPPPVDNQPSPAAQELTASAEPFASTPGTSSVDMQVTDNAVDTSLPSSTPAASTENPLETDHADAMASKPEQAMAQPSVSPPADTASPIPAAVPTVAETAPAVSTEVIETQSIAMETQAHAMPPPPAVDEPASQPEPMEEDEPIKEEAQLPVKEENVDQSQHQPSASPTSTPIQPSLQDPLVVAPSAPPSQPPRSRSDSQNGYRPLNVKDALTYLDLVKMQFSDHPEVYNKFLDIMKDFKSQAIDTPGVIERVSTLFRGHPQLISGFNTFLPPGYCIECITDDQDNDVIKVTTPQGTTTSVAGEPLRLGSDSAPPHDQLYYGHLYSYGHPPPPGHQPPPHLRGPMPMAPPRYGQTPPPAHLPHHMPPPPPGYQPMATYMPPPPPPALAVDEGSPHRRPPVEFNHAINYVNKIKNRFSGEPDVYKQFLEILQTYQKEQRPIQEVYSQVQTLFNGDNDLLAEFKQFLPDSSGPPAVYTSAPASGNRKGLVMVPGLPSVGAPPTSRRKRPTTMIQSGLTKRSKLRDDEIQTSEVRSGLVEEDVIRPFVSGEEVEFFERAKKYIGSKVTYNAFLKVLNLFSQQVVDQNVLVNRVEGILGGNKELFDMFKTLVGYDGKDELIENVPDENGKSELDALEAYGPSYRGIPKSWQGQVCSGKDELCLEVLNDLYVSHPTWASEDSAYVAAKKNQYEEALHRVEEERYDYDLNIEANLNTIALLEPIMKKISTMAAEEKQEFTLPVGLGGPSKTIYQRIIKKIYGVAKGLEVIELLHNNPAQSVPIVLKRLKQKDDEWKRAQREWNKIWREVEAKNYLKALDYQGITFKQMDKRQMTSKNLITDIEERKLQQLDQQQQLMQDRDAGGKLLTPPRRPPQYIFDMPNKNRLGDVTRLIKAFLQQHADVYDAVTQEKIHQFLVSLLPVFFDGSIEPVHPGLSRLATIKKEPNPVQEDENEEDDEDDDEDDEDEDDESHSSYDSDGDVIMNKERRQRRQVPKTQNEVKEPTTTSTTYTVDVPDVKMTEPEPSAAPPNTHEPQDKPDAVTPVVDPVPPTPSSSKRHIFNLFADSEMFCFFRLYQLLYDRLLALYLLGEEYKQEPEKTGAKIKAPLNLTVQSKSLDGILCLSRLASILNHIFVIGYQMDFTRGYYETLMVLTEKYLHGEIDSSLYEEVARYVFGNKVYTMFTVDRLVASLLRHIHFMVTTESTAALVELFLKHHDLESVDAQSLGDYRVSVENVLGKDEALFNISFDTVRRRLSIQLLGYDEEYHPITRDDYEEYVSSYIDSERPTKDINPALLTKRYLSRNLMRCNEEQARQSVVLKSGMQYKICHDTYHMFYINGTEDVFCRIPASQQQSAVPTSSSLDSLDLWARGLENKEQAEADARKLLLDAM
ncbi:hypothetical protein DM01DRAFT_1003788 [Hesseltinella vesiculosa]|uniref:Histone deacetylase interacting domain-containing protein n=1 Tax=Hesseltinella vesiculosa TaxID=101127 RepID=A0A1X2GX88_9FUNG|nr:hypothetical protein DM01DRAFT_1003788 [Hesseltinella vesiculosa]